MITIRAGNGAIGICLLLLLTGCSREQQDWRSAEAADTIEAYGHFIQRHPESELATQARTRVLQLGEDRDWQHAGSADNVDAYREFMTQHPNGKWAQEARIRIENFSLGEQAGTDAASRSGIGVAGGSAAGGRNRATARAPGAGAGAGADSSLASPGAGARAGSGLASPGPGAGAGSALALPGEAAVPAARSSSAPTTAAGSSSGGSRASAAGSAGAASTSSNTGVTRSPGPSGSPGASSPTTAAPQATAQLAAPPTAPKAAFGIQLGAFSSESGANSEWHLLVGRFGPELQGLTEHVIPADASSGRIYRLQAIVGDEARARAICDSLRKRSQGCVAVLPH
jgi:SPOR domain